MLSLAPQLRIFVAREAVDFRRGFDGLAAIARDSLGLDPLAGHVFVFLNKRRNRIKLLVWDNNGYWLCYKRLERGTFQSLHAIPREDARLELSRSELAALLEGIDLKNLKRSTHYHEHVRMSSRRPDDRQELEAQG